MISEAFNGLKFGAGEELQWEERPGMIVELTVSDVML